MALTGFLTISALLILILIYLPSKLHILEILCIGLVAAYLMQSSSIVFATNLQWIKLTDDNLLIWAEFFKEVFMIPLLIVLTVHFVRGRNRGLQLSGVLLLILIVFVSDYIAFQAGTYQIIHWGIWAILCESAAIVVITLFCHAIFLRILQKDLR